MSPVVEDGALTPVLRDARSVRPFRSSEDYLTAMKEDLAEWLNHLYPELNMSTELFMERLDTGVALCKHANTVLAAARSLQEERAEWLAARPGAAQAQLVAAVAAHGPLALFPSARQGTFYARDNVSNFIAWARGALGVRDVILFETDDLILRKNEKHVVLTLLDVARRGARLGVAAPVLVQLEREIDREIAAEQRSGRAGSGGEGDSEAEDLDDEELLLPAGPQPQLVTNDLKSLHDMVRELVEQCQCPVQFPMIRVSEGKYRVGDSKMLIFVRVLRKHVMVRVGGGWDTLAHFLQKHDPCRCRTSHRSPFNARLMLKAGAGGIEMTGSSVTYDRSPPRTRRSSASSVSSGGGAPCCGPQGTPGGLAPSPYGGGGRAGSRSRSPTPTPSAQRRSTGAAPAASGLAAPRAARSRSRSRSPAPGSAPTHSYIPGGLAPQRPPSRRHSANLGESPALGSEAPPPPPLPTAAVATATATVAAAGATTTDGQTNTDSGSEVSDEGYRSLGAVASPPQAPPPPPPPLPSAAQQYGGQSAGGSPRRLAVPGAGAPRSRRSSADSRRSVSPAPASPRASPSPARRRLSGQPQAAPAPATGSPAPRMARSRSACGGDGGMADAPWESPRRGAPGRTSLRGDSRASPVPSAAAAAAAPAGAALANGGSLGRAAGRRTRESLGARNSPQRRSLGAGSTGSSPGRQPPARPPNGCAAPAGAQQQSLPASLQGSPTRHFSPLLQQILAADDLASDAIVLQKMREIIKQYSDVVPPASSDAASDASAADAPAASANCDALPDAPGLDFTSAWVHGNGVIRPHAGSPAPSVGSGRKSSAASTATSVSVGPSPRRDSKPDGGATRIPLPVFFTPPAHAATADC